MWQASTICRATVVSSVLCLPEIINGGGAASPPAGGGGGRGNDCSSRVGRRHVSSASRLSQSHVSPSYRCRGQCRVSSSNGSSLTISARLAAGRREEKRQGGLESGDGGWTSVHGIRSAIAPFKRTMESGIASIWNGEFAAHCSRRDGGWQSGVSCRFEDGESHHRGGRVRSGLGREISVLNVSLVRGAQRAAPVMGDASGGPNPSSRVSAVGPGGDGGSLGDDELLSSSRGGGGGGGGTGDGGAGGGGGYDGRGDDSEDEDSETKGHSKKLLVSQVLTLTYAAFLALGGLIGFIKSKSGKSLASGVGAALILLYVSSQLPTAPLYASFIGLVLAGGLTGVMGKRYAASKKIFPAGVTALLSLLMSVGYVHGIARNQH